MAENKTQPTRQSVDEFLKAVEDDQRRQDCYALVEMMRDVTGEESKMWGPSIVGFGSYHYKYASGQEGDWLEVGFSPRKRDLSLYLMGGLVSQKELLDKLGKHQTGKSCLYVNKLTDVDQAVLRALIEITVKAVRAGEIRY